MSIVTLGSFMMDLVVCTQYAPKNGETVIGHSFQRFLGGKGANQAVAVHRLGIQVIMIGRVGNDEFGDDFIRFWKSEGMDATYIQRDPIHATGVGSIVVDQTGQNRIVVVPGANLHYNEQDILKVSPIIAQAKLLMMQLEMDISTIEAAAQMAYIHQVPILLNPAPAVALNPELLQKITYLTPNETELEILTGKTIGGSMDNIKTAAMELVQMGVKHVIVTLGEKGAAICSEGFFEVIDGYVVDVKDTVAAGDSFNGAMAVKIINGSSLNEAVKYANAVGAISVTKNGAIPSLPTKQEVDTFLQIKR